MNSVKILYDVIPPPSLTGGSLYGILEFPASLRGSNLVQNSVIAKIAVIASEAKQSLGILDFYPRNSRIPYYVILGLDPRISIEILNLFVMRSPDQVGG